MRIVHGIRRFSFTAAMLATLASPASAFPSRIWDHAPQRGMGLSLRLFHFGLGHKPHDDRAVVTRKEGRRVLDFAVREEAPRLFVHVTGEVEFERADIGFADGSVQSVDAYGVDRDSGLYELASFPATRSIAWVRLVLRARSRNARVGIKLAA